MLENTIEEQDLSNDFNNPPEKSYDLFGKVIDLKTFKGAYRTGFRGAQPFDPAIDKNGHSFIKFYIQPLPEINVKYQDQLTYESTNWGDWAKITWPSLKALGIVDYHEIENRFFRFARVPTGKTYPKSDGTTGEEKTWKIVDIFADEEACRAAYIAAGGKSDGNGASDHNKPVHISADDSSRAAAHVFLRDVIVPNAAKGKEDFASVKAAIAETLAQPGYAPVAKFFTADSPEALQLITDQTGFLPF